MENVEKRNLLWGVANVDINPQRYLYLSIKTELKLGQLRDLTCFFWGHCQWEARTCVTARSYPTGQG